MMEQQRPQESVAGEMVSVGSVRSSVKVFDSSNYS
jgi:hypothetical protein